MPDKKLTDGEIVRILEETIEYNNRIGRPTAIMDIYSLELFLELIKRQNEQLQANSDSRQINECENINIAHIKAEAYKEFAEKLNAEAEKVEIDREGDFVETVNKIYNTVADWCKATSDNLLKELVGEDK